ncbi:hypothetical protein TREMEDRAFT_63783 [Tremella mesenterica DSM 1558]|uniref:uncharacterized protein n=1 Tax=Tremella mesenterica (strain ATCC 24925 / CBS 8224 / DSM 1558 / NBRC 9311 / NRRL Y-6157 / RJB 2259-6 / UBC 559-6) TaxID=578456 RepID=UPI0003F48C01|nr:uncharacterized protein TREMEDRAFT_63783 [Tremella mesenterica DSM 1558]EIW67892.1 hypothetical protein TREMEDRAFT_63783 [Tremella mesenterica DSM 1558]
MSSGTNGQGDYCLIHWHGTDIAVYGARRGNHVRYLSCPHHLTNPNRRSSASARIGIYGVSVDNGDVSYYSGYASPDEFQVVLYATSGLSEGDHTIKISNENARDTDQYPSYVWMDIDYAAITGTTLNPTATTTQTSTTPTTTSTQATTSTTSSVPPSSSSSSPAAESTSSSQSVVSTPTSQPLPSSSSSSSSSFSSVSLNAQQYSASTTIVATTTAVNGPSGPVTGTSSASASKSSKAGAASDNSGSSTSKNTKLAICIPVIVISAAVIVAVGLVWYIILRIRGILGEIYNTISLSYSFHTP